jgi:hypothetical protein
LRPSPDPPSLWAPQRGPQAAFVANDLFEVVYGGARGGGKTDAALGDFSFHAARYGRGAKGLLVRRTRVALEPTIDRARAIFAGVQWRASRSAFVWPSGAILAFRHLDRDADADLYQGHDYTRVYVEEMTQFPDPRAIDKLKATLRSAAGVPCGFRATCNPGGPGHGWVKARYIDAGPWRIVEEGGLSRLFIPARLADNPRLDEADPLYRARLRQSGSAALVRAWLEGDWNIVEGAFFDRWGARNVVAPFAIPVHWTRFRSFDWGYAVPFSVGWWAIASEPTAAESPSAGPLTVPRGAMVRYREWYGGNGKPDSGARLTAEEIAAGIKVREERDLEAGAVISYGVADPSIFSEDGGPSHAERMRRMGMLWRPADNTRVGRAGALSGWDQMRARIAGTAEGPMLVVFETCRDFLRTVPGLQHDRARAEDLDTDGEDHIADETRYACLSRPITAADPGPEPPPRPQPRPEWDWEAMRSQGKVNMWKAM